MSFLITATKPDALRSCITTDTSCASGIRDPISLACVKKNGPAYKFPVEGRVADGKGYCFDATLGEGGRSAIGRWVLPDPDHKRVRNPLTNESIVDDAIEFIREREGVRNAEEDPYRTTPEIRRLMDSVRGRDINSTNDILTSPDFDVNVNHSMFAMILAVQMGYTEIVRVFINAGMNLNTVYPWQLFFILDGTGYRRSVGCIAILEAAERGYDIIVHLLINANVELHDRTTAQYDRGNVAGQLLISACDGRRTRIVELLIRTGAVTLDDRDSSGLPVAMDALMTASDLGCVDIVDLLLPMGMDVNATSRDGYRSAIWWAAKNGHAAVVARLLLANATAPVSEAEKNYALAIATANGRDEVVRVIQASM